MHRFWTCLNTDQFRDVVENIFSQAEKVTLNIGPQDMIGPKNTPVNHIELTHDILTLHMRLYETLKKMPVEFTATEWVGEGYVPHVSTRDDLRLSPGQKIPCRAVYLIEAKVPGYEHKRIVRCRFNLGQKLPTTVQ